MTLTKTCACGKEFVSKHHLQIHCTRRCNNERNLNCKEWNDRQRNYKYKINYGISIDDYNSLFEEQEGCCAICKRHQSTFKSRLHVDHNHKTGEVRGLLCHGCNLALGRLMEDKEIIKNMLEYVS